VRLRETRLKNRALTKNARARHPASGSVGIVREITYTSKSLPAQKAYRCGQELVVLPGASFPDICVACGKPAHGGLIHREFYDLGDLWFMLPNVLKLVAYVLRKQYLFEFPFCANCPSGPFHLVKMRCDDHLAAFTGAHQVFIDSLPFASLDLVEERNQGWLQRRFRWLFG
jgi:hypothetical protein